MSTLIEPGSIVRVVKDASFIKLDDDFVAINAQTGVGYALNATSKRVWDLCASPISVEALCAQLRSEFSVDEQTCLREVTAILKSMSEAGVVQVQDAPPL